MNMAGINLGLKLWSLNDDLLDEAKGLVEENIFQYIELAVIPDTDVIPFLEAGLPYIIHATTERYGVNIADRKKRGYNLEAVNNCIRWADELNAKYLILHPGFGLIDDAIEFLEGIDDMRVVIENMPEVGLNDEELVGYTPKQIRLLMGGRFGFCMDFGHAYKAAVSTGTDYKMFLKDFLDVGPSMFHLCDGDTSNVRDEHLHLGEGNLDLGYIISLLHTIHQPYVTLETPRNSNSLKEDIKNVSLLREKGLLTSP